MDTLGPVAKNGTSAPAFCIADSNASNGISGDDLVTQLFQGELISQVTSISHIYNPNHIYCLTKLIMQVISDSLNQVCHIGFLARKINDINCLISTLKHLQYSLQVATRQ